jgi:hypothetical protein
VEALQQQAGGVVCNKSYGYRKDKGSSMWQLCSAFSQNSWLIIV